MPRCVSVSNVPSVFSPAVTAVLFVGDWGYPLCGQPVLAMGLGEYLLPDAGSTVDTSRSWLLVVGPEAAAGLTSLLTEHATVRARRDHPEFEPASSLSRGIVSTGAAAAAALVYLGGVVGGGLRMGSSLLRRVVKPRADPVVVHGTTKAAVSSLSAASTATAAVTGTVVTGVTAVASSVGQWVAGEVRRRGLFDRASASSSPAMAIAKDVACASVVAASAVFEGLENAALVVFKDASTATHEFVRHRYGAEAGELASEAGTALAGAGQTAANVRRMGVRPLVAATAKVAVKEHIKHSTP